MDCFGARFGGYIIIARVSSSVGIYSYMLPDDGWLLAPEKLML